MPDSAIAPSDKVKQKYTGDVYGAAKKATGIGPDPTNDALMNHWLWGPIIRRTGADPSVAQTTIDLASLISGLNIGEGGARGFSEGVAGLRPKEPTNTLNLSTKLSPENTAALSLEMDPATRAQFKSAWDAGKGHEFIQQHITTQDPTLPMRAGFDNIKYRELSQIDPRFATQSTQADVNAARPQADVSDPAESAYRSILASLPTNPKYKMGGQQ